MVQQQQIWQRHRRLVRRRCPAKRPGCDVLLFQTVERCGGCVAGEEMSVDAALASVRARRSGAQPNAGFMRQLVDYEASLRRPPPVAAPREAAVAEQGPKQRCGICGARRNGAPHGAVTAATDAGQSGDQQTEESTGEGDGRSCGASKTLPGSDSFRCVQHGSGATGPSARGLGIENCSTVWAGEQSPPADESPTSPRQLCGAIFLASRCGGDDVADMVPDPAPSPQSSAGDYSSYQGTPVRAASGAEGWGVPAFSLNDGFPTLLSTQEQASARVIC